MATKTISLTNQIRANELRNKSVKYHEDAIESFERCDTDGFMSQWASQVNSRSARLEAELVENGYMDYFYTLADAEGNLIPCKKIKTRYGLSWAIFNTFNDAENYGSQIIQWVGLGDRAVANKGYQYVRVVSMGKVILGKGWNPQPFIVPSVEVFTPNNCRKVSA